jgi:hypothetical protein
MDDGAEKETASGPAVDVVEFLVTVAWTEKEGENRILCGEKKHYWELSDCEKACMYEVCSCKTIRRQLLAHQHDWDCPSRELPE